MKNVQFNNRSAQAVERAIIECLRNTRKAAKSLREAAIRYLNRRMS